MMKQIILDQKFLDKVLEELSCLLILLLEVSAFLIIVYYSINSAFSGEIESPKSSWPKSTWTENQHRETTLAEVQQGSLLFKTDRAGRYIAAPTVSTDVDLKVTGMIVRATVTQKFTNDTGQWLEGIYAFPLPEDAAVDHLKMFIGERIIEGKIKQRAEAKKIYTKARREGKKASLIEQQRPNLFSNSIANIAPHETIKVVIEYQQSIQYSVSEKNIGEFNLRFPLAINPRYIPGKVVSKTLTENLEVGEESSRGWAMNTDQVPDASLIMPPVSRNKINNTTLRVELDAGFPIESINAEYHKVSKIGHGEGKVTITLLPDSETEKTNFADRDFSLTWQAAVGKQPRAAVFSQKQGADYYHLLMIMPPNELEENKGQQQKLDREVIYILDTSGSMGGASIRQARKALLLAIDRLSPRETFNVIEFNSTAHKLFSKAVQATYSNKNSAKRFVSNLNANGGTEMATALNLAFENTQNQERARSMSTNRIRQIIFLTDGSVGNEEMLFGLIKQKLGTSRLFTIGIGSAPNSHFMTKAAKFGRGTFTYIGDVNEVQQKMDELFSKLDAPILKNIKISYNSSKAIEAWPKQQPDLYLGEPIIVVTKSAEALNSIELSAQMNNRKWQLDLKVGNAEENGDIGVLWARKKITHLTDSLFDGMDKDSIKNKVTEVALNHHLVSQYTSLVAVDVTPSRPTNENINKHAFKTNLPKGMIYKKVSGQLPQTATEAEMNILTGLILLLIALLMIRQQQKLNQSEKPQLETGINDEE